MRSTWSQIFKNIQIYYMDNIKVFLTLPLAGEAVATKTTGFKSREYCRKIIHRALWDLYELQISLVKIKSTFHELVLKYLSKQNMLIYLTQLLNLKDFASVFQQNK